MKILFATDGSEFAHVAIQKSTEILKTTDSVKIKIISVVELINPFGGGPIGSQNEIYRDANLNLEKRAKKAIADAVNLLEEFTKNKIKIESEIFNGNPKKTIVEEAENWEANLVVLGSHGYGFWERMLIGSVSEHVLHHAHCSVLIIRKS